jgi:hypothetical protein
MKRILQIVPLVALGVAIASFVLTVAARKKEITCEYLGSSRLVAVNSSGLPSDVKVEYNGQPVTSLTKLTFLIRNSGAAAIKREDVRDPLKLVFPTQVRVLNATTDRTSPQPFEFQSKVAADSQTVVFDFALLNAGDEANVSVYIINSDPVSPVFIGRIVDVPSLIFATRVDEPANTWSGVRLGSHAVRGTVRWILVLLQSIFALLFGGLTITAVVSYIQYLPWRRQWSGRYQEVVTAAREEFKRLHPRTVRNLNDLMSDSDDDLQFEFERATALEMRGIHSDRSQFIQEKLREAKIPAQPSPMFESLGGVIGFTISFGGMSAAFTLAAYLSFVSLRG